MNIVGIPKCVHIDKHIKSRAQNRDKKIQPLTQTRLQTQTQKQTYICILGNHFMTLTVMQLKGYCHIDCATIVSRLETFGQGRSLHLHSHVGPWPKLTNSNVAGV